MKTWIVTVLSLVLCASPSRAADCTVTSMDVLGLDGTPSPYVSSADHQFAGILAAQSVVPRDASGAPSASGKIGVLEIGMSNGKMIGNALAYYLQHVAPYTTQRNLAVVVINANQSSQTAEAWANPSHLVWTKALQLVASKGLTVAQVQVVYDTMAQKTPAQYGPLTATALQAIDANVHAKFPAVQIHRLSSITYTGYASGAGLTLQPEPSPHNDGLLMASLVEGQGWATPFVGFDDVWANGVNVNPLTGMNWQCADVQYDGVHPVENTIGVGAGKIANSLLGRWLVDPVMRWFWK